ncbi:MAG: hypothetical protein LBT46_06690 [Planctomycetaceae bacterium]|jgi:hypothetical protein|nr:hypothetical protein [Planctomycetaceae bacterium]
MKKVLSLASLLFLAAVGATLSAAELPATGDYDLDRESAKKAFDTLLEKGKNTPIAAAVKGAVKLEAIAPVEIPVKLTAIASTGDGAAAGAIISGTAHVASATKIWFELVNGGYVNPKTYKFAPGELVYVSVLASQPISVTIYQKDEQGEQRRKFPVDRFPNSFAVIQPGVPTRLPVLFQIDKDFNPEKLSLVIANVSSPAIRTQVVNTIQAEQQSKVEASASASATVALSVARIGSKNGTLKADVDAADKVFADISAAGIDEKNFTEGAVKCRRVRFFRSYPVYVRPVYYTRYVSTPVSVVQNNPVNELRINGNDNNVNYNVVNNSSTVVGTPLASTASSTISYNYQTVAVSSTTNVALVEKRATYPNAEDVAFYLISENGVGQLSLTLEKTGANFIW